MTEMIVTLQLRNGSKITATESINAGPIDGRYGKEIATIAAAEAKGLVVKLMEQSVGGQHARTE